MLRRSRVIALLGSAVIEAAACRPQPSPTPTPALPGGAVLSWGGNSDGQLGDGSTSQRLTPALVTGVQSVKGIAAGGNTSMALTTDGRVFTWGGGQSTPVEVTAVQGATSIASGSRHRLALMPDGTVRAWGDNSAGQLGDNSTANRSSPVRVVGLPSIRAIAAGGDQSYAIAADLSLWAWGANGNGQLGDGSTTNRETPVKIGTMQVIEVKASSRDALALSSNVEVFGWGSNATCQLLENPRTDPFAPIVCSDHQTPTRLLAFGTPGASTTGDALAGTLSSSLIVMSDGTVRAVGADPTTQPQYSGLCDPEPSLGYVKDVILLSDIRATAAGDRHGIFLTAQGEIWVLGANAAGQLGLGTTSVLECPTRVPPSSIRGAVAAVGGAEHSLALVKGLLTTNPPGPIDLGAQLVGTVGTLPVTVTSGGLVPVVFAAARATGDFTASDQCTPNSPLAPGTSCTVTVGFSPTATGARSGTLEVTSNALVGILQVQLVGKGTEPIVSFNVAEIDFGTVAAGSKSATSTAVISNTGDGPLQITGLVATAGFELSSDNCPRAPSAVVPQGTCNVDVRFAPTQTGAAVGELRVLYGGKTTALRLKGTGQ